MSMEITTTLRDLNNLITEEVNKENFRKANIVKVSRKQLIESLTETITEINQKYRESKKFWRKTIEIYQKFISQNPGSQQMKAPSPSPKLPERVETIKGYIKLFKAYTDEDIILELAFLKEIFSVSSLAISEINEIRTSFANMATGSMILYDSISSIR